MKPASTKTAGPLRNETDYRAALEEIELLMAAQAGTAEGERLDALVKLVEAYEAIHYPMK